MADPAVVGMAVTVVSSGGLAVTLVGPQAGTLTFSGAITFSGGATFSGSTLDMSTNRILNIGNAGTDFLANGGLTLANILTITTGGLTVTAGTVAFTAGSLNIGAPNNRNDTPGISVRSGTLNGDSEVLYMEQVNVGTGAGLLIEFGLFDTTSVRRTAGEIRVTKGGGTWTDTASTRDTIMTFKTLTVGSTVSQLVLNGFTGIAVITGGLSVSTTTMLTGATTLNGATTRAVDGIQIGAASSNNLLDDASNGAASQALFIGNAQVTAVSDKRIKANIRPSQINATDLILRTPVVDHTWDHPADSAPVNKNSRGPWVGIVAQDLIKTMPWLVNAEDRTCEDCLNGKACDKHKGLWQVDFDYMTAVLAKGFQELEGRVATLEARPQ